MGNFTNGSVKPVTKVLSDNHRNIDGSVSRKSNALKENRKLGEVNMVIGESIRDVSFLHNFKKDRLGKRT